MAVLSLAACKGVGPQPGVPADLAGFYVGTISDPSFPPNTNLIFNLIRNGDVYCCAGGAGAAIARYSPNVVVPTGSVRREGKQYVSDLELGSGLSLGGTFRVVNGIGVGSGEVVTGVNVTGIWSVTLLVKE